MEKEIKNLLGTATKIIDQRKESSAEDRLTTDRVVYTFRKDKHIKTMILKRKGNNLRMIEADSERVALEFEKQAEIE